MSEQFELLHADIRAQIDMTGSHVITVGMASYNRPELLKRAIQSAVSQTYRNLEILISDNGSPNPEVRAVIDEFARSDRRIRSIFHPVNQGAFFNFRSVLNEAKGKYFVWLADDDYWSPEYLDRLLQESVRTGAALTYGRAEIVDIEIAAHDRVVKEMPTTLGRLAAMARFVRFDTDAIFYGLFLTTTGKKLAGLLCDWRVPSAMAKDYPFLAYNFVSYAFIFGLMSSGGFCNASSDKAVHYTGGRAPFSHSPRVGWRHLGLLLAYVLVHMQMVWRFSCATFVVGSAVGMVVSPLAALYLFSRRIGMIISLRLKRSFGLSK